ncbi:hypothetical protein ASE36_10700 [Rhizobium sp. Root274]|uniref:DUF6220 domain-containing protein n=1 Tax=unclassified Rhizobium TaxID=2613769 RepID=UPI000714C0C9|nr:MULTISPECIES: DUF6220 domain-containing protein [unclassified Rhizobium]KQW28943.1 hypothetical protein ASC71_10715 [Rhizobium sp. Root1240]KRD29139.1 hypothetical protein ASE36_10700 [Rhizobium sp. Root274]
MTAGLVHEQGRGLSFGLFSGFAVLALVGIAGQFLLAGMSIFGAADAWGLHGLSGGLLSVPVLGMLGLALAIPGLHRFRRDVGVLTVVYLLQVTLAGLGAGFPLLGALHPLNGLIMADVAMGITKARFSRG